MPRVDRAKQNQYQREWYSRNKEQHCALVRDNNKRYVAERHKMILGYLAEHPCVDCGESDPVVLDFDHVRGVKTGHVSTLAWALAPWDRVLAEIAKCEVRCANCHRRATHERRVKAGYNQSEDGMAHNHSATGATPVPAPKFNPKPTGRRHKNATRIPAGSPVIVPDQRSL